MGETDESLQKHYGKSYFARYGPLGYGYHEPWLSFFARIAEHIVAEIAPKTALDIGCAQGILIKALRERDVDAYGIDVSPYAIEQASPEIRPFCSVGSILDPLPQTYDLIVCIEVVEHLPPERADDALRNMCDHTSDVLFSSTSDEFTEPTHLNVRPTEYWAERFARFGFHRDLDFDGSVIGPYAMRFRTARDPLHRLVASYERKLRLERRELSEVRRALLAADERVIELQEAAAPSYWRSLALRALRQLRARRRGGD